MPPGLVKSALRVLELFELFETEQRGLRVVDIARRLDAPQSSISMLVKTLHTRGYLSFDPDTRTYEPSARLSFLGNWAIGIGAKRVDIDRIMLELAEASGETVLLGLRNNLLVQYLAIVPAAQPVRLVIGTGTRRPLHRSAIGIVLLAEMKDDVIGRTIRRYNAELGDAMGRASLDATMRSVERARKDNYFVSQGLSTPDTGMVATVIPGAPGERQLGLGIAAPLSRLLPGQHEWAAMLRRRVSELVPDDD